VIKILPTVAETPIDFPNLLMTKPSVTLMVVARIASILRDRMASDARDIFAYNIFRFSGRTMPRNERTIADAELIRDRIIKARKSFSSDSTNGPRVEMAVMSSPRAGDETLVPTTTRELGILVLISLMPSESFSQGGVYDLRR
jgi:hypothetical protein